MSFTVNITFKGALFETTSKAERDQIGWESIKMFLGQIFLLKIHLQKRMRIFTKFYKVNWEVLRRSREVWSGHHSEASEFVKKIDKKTFRLVTEIQVFEYSRRLKMSSYIKILKISETRQILIDYPRSWQDSRCSKRNDFSQESKT